MPWAEDRCWRDCGKANRPGFNLVRCCRQQAILRTSSKHTIIETPTHTQLVSVSMNIQKWNSTRLRTKTSYCELRNWWCYMLFKFRANTWRIITNIPAFKRMRGIQTFWRECIQSPNRRPSLSKCNLRKAEVVSSIQICFNKFFTRVNEEGKLWQQ